VTGQEVILDLLRYIGVTGFTAVDNDQRLNRPGLDNDDIRRALAALNSALQTIQKYGPQALKDDERAAFFNNPTSVQIVALVTNGQSATLSAPPPAWMLGCSILVPGDSDMNRIMDITGSDFSFLRGYRGPGGVVTATVYADCALLGPDISAVLEPVNGSQITGIITNHKTLRHADLDTFINFQREIASQSSPANLVGIAELYHVERRRDGDLFLRVAPIPGSGMNVTFKAKLRAERVTEGIIDESGVSDPGYEFTSLNQDDVESILLPIARWKFFTHPALKNAEARQAVKMEYDEAILALRNGASFEPNVAAEHVTYI
jgi:hypothetical protein